MGGLYLDSSDPFCAFQVTSQFPPMSKFIKKEAVKDTFNLAREVRRTRLLPVSSRLRARSA